jgi:DNA invertase Pin-like site-specific DNA recombinase
MPSELITPAHLARKAIIYIRQSSPHQVLTNQESLRLQYALRQRARELGWRDDAIETIDADLGLSGAQAAHRAGFKELIARVTLGQIGIILSSEVTRLTRNCSDWYPLLDLCGYGNCLIADREGVYDPGTANGRLLLGLKGTISEVELHTIRARLTAGLLSKAARGELALVLPAGLMRDPSGVVTKDPDREVQARIALVFATFLRVRSACRVLRVLNDQNLDLPRRNRLGDTVWRKPTVAAILAILKNPAYAGAFVYGRTRALRAGPPVRRAAQKRVPQEQWRIVVKDKYPAYISWETFAKIQAMLRDNHAEYDRNQTRGIPREGAALLHGLVYCGECGHKMVVQYKNGTRYICNYLHQQHGVPVCQYIPGDPIDAAVVAAFLKAVEPAELEALSQALISRQTADQAMAKAQAQRIERLRYRAALAERQYNKVDPDNRLVAAELERRWEDALRELTQAEAAARQDSGISPPVLLTPERAAAFAALGQRLPQLWNHLAAARRKALLRCLIDKVVIRRAAPDQIALRIVWRGGAVTALAVPVTVGSLAALSRAAEMEARLLELARQGHSDQAIAAELTRAGHRSPMHDRVLPSTVQIIRLKHRVLRNRCQSHPRRVPGYLTVPQLARRIQTPVHWIYDRIHKGTIAASRDEKTGLYLFPDTPATVANLKQLKAGHQRQLGFPTKAAS